MKRTHFSEFSISRFSTYIRKGGFLFVAQGDHLTAGDWAACASALKMSKLSISCQIRSTTKNNIDIIFYFNLFNLAVRAKTSHVLAG